MTARDSNPVLLADLVRLSLSIADRAVIDDIRSMTVHTPHAHWLDTRPMLDQREHSPLYLDMADQALRYAEYRRLIVRHTTETHLVRFTRAPD